MEGGGESHIPVPSDAGYDLPYESERRFYGTGLEAVVNSASAFAQRDYETVQDMSRNAASGTRFKRASFQVRNMTESYSNITLHPLSIVIVILFTALRKPAGFLLRCS
jgi:hypothetical protein